MRDNFSMIDVEKVWNLKVEAHNNMMNYVESKGLDESELLQFVELLNKYSNSAIKFDHCL